MVFGSQVRSLAVGHQIVKLLLAGKKVPHSLLLGPPFAFDGGLSTDAYQQMTITQHPGVWIIVCLMDTQDGRQHTQLGMERIIRILP